MFVRCKVFRSNFRKTNLSRNQVSDIGYCECFHMSRANKLSKLRGHRFSMSKKISHEAHPFFCRSSDYAKWKRDIRKPYFTPEEWKEWLKEIDRED